MLRPSTQSFSFALFPTNCCVLVSRRMLTVLSPKCICVSASPYLPGVRYRCCSYEFQTAFRITANSRYLRQSHTRSPLEGQIGTDQNRQDRNGDITHCSFCVLSLVPKYPCAHPQFTVISLSGCWCCCCRTGCPVGHGGEKRRRRMRQ